MDSDRFFATQILPIVIRVGLAVITILIGRYLARFGRRTLLVALKKTDLTESLINLFTTLTYYSIVFLAVLLALGIIGFPVTALVAAIGIAVIILGIALQESLSNFAATIIFLLFKPFSVGDFIETENTLGTVREIQLFNTVLLKADQKLAILPNGKIQNNGVVNYSHIGILRADMVFGISYDDDLKKAKEILEDLLSNDARVLSDPPPKIFVLELGDSSVDIAVWPFVNAEDYFQIRWDMVEQVKLRFDAAGITIPFPQRDVHLNQSD